MLIAGGAATLILAAGSARAAPRAQADLVEFEKMTWVEVKAALAAGKTTALIYTGGTEQRGPQLANGYHNLVAHAQRSEEHTSELQSRGHLVCRLLLEKKKKTSYLWYTTM